VLTFASLAARDPGALLIANSQNNGTAIFDLGQTSQSRLVFTPGFTLDDGIIGAWAVVQTSATQREFAKYVGSGTISLTQLVTADYAGTLASGSNPAQNVRITATPAALSLNTEINSLTLNQASATTIDIGAGNTLRVESGGIAVNNNFNANFINGTLTAGTGANAPGELVIHAVSAAANPVVIDSVIADNGLGSVTLTKGGAGVLDLQGVTNTYTGRTFVTGGTIRINADANLGLAPAAPSVGHLTTGSNAIIEITQDMTLNANRGIALGGGATVFSMSAGLAGAGANVTYNGGFTTVAGTNEAGLTFQSNATTTNIDPGTFSGTLTAPINIGGPLRLEAGSITTGGGANVIGRSLQVALNGTASFIQSSGTLTVGAGINDTLDVGVSGSDTINKVGTLNLAGVSQFTANVDQVRIGVVTGGTASAAQGIVTFATNNDITAGTSILVGDSNAAGLATQTLTFGTGQHNVTTQTLTFGGRKATNNVTIGAGATLNLQGFGQRTLNAFVGRQNVDTAGLNTSSLNTSNGTFVGSFNSLSVGVKSATGTNTGGADATLTLGSSAANNVETNTLDLGNRSQMTGTAINNSRAFGTLNMAGGNFTVFNNVNLGTLLDNGTAKGVLNLTGGTFTVGGNITKTDSDRSAGTITVNGATLSLQNTAAGDATPGAITASQLFYRSGSVGNAAGITLDGRGVTDGVTFAAQDDALVVRDVSLTAPVTLTNATVNKGGVHYEAAGGGSGAVLGGIDLGTVGRTFNVENSAGAVADLSVNGAINGAVALTKTGTGTLLLNNTVAGSVNVNAGILGGTGTIAGAVNIAAAGTLAPRGEHWHPWRGRHDLHQRFRLPTGDQQHGAHD
jgi:autotransporter-associated beta strand protein